MNNIQSDRFCNLDVLSAVALGILPPDVYHDDIFVYVVLVDGDMASILVNSYALPVDVPLDLLTPF